MPPHVLERVGAHRPLVMHGVSLSIGSTDPLDFDYLGKLARARRASPAGVDLRPPLLDRRRGLNTHDLLPMPLTEASLAHVVERVRAVQDFLGRPLVLENPSTYLQFAGLDRWPSGSSSRRSPRTPAAACCSTSTTSMSARSTTAIDPDRLYRRVAPRAHRADPPRRAAATAAATHRHPRQPRARRRCGNSTRRRRARTGGVSTLLEWDANIPPFDGAARRARQGEAWRAAPVPCLSRWPRCRAGCSTASAPAPPRG